MTFFSIMSFRHNERSWVHNAVIDHRAGFDRSAFIFFVTFFVSYHLMY